MSKPNKSTNQAPKASRRGVSNHNYAVADAVTSSCPKCGSTDRVPYYRKTEHERLTTPTGQQCTHAVLRYTRCKGCGQHRIDRTFENRRRKRKDDRPAA